MSEPDFIRHGPPPRASRGAYNAQPEASRRAPGGHGDGRRERFGRAGREASGALWASGSVRAEAANRDPVGAGCARETASLPVIASRPEPRTGRAPASHHLTGRRRRRMPCRCSARCCTCRDRVSAVGERAADGRADRRDDRAAVPEPRDGAADSRADRRRGAAGDPLRPGSDVAGPARGGAGAERAVHVLQAVVGLSLSSGVSRRKEHST